MMSIPAVSMSRIAVCTASSNISSMSPGPISPASHAFTAVNHQPGLPWDPTTEVGRRGSVIMAVIVAGAASSGRVVGGPPGCALQGCSDDTRQVRAAAQLFRSAGEDDFAALDDVEAGR